MGTVYMEINGVMFYCPSYDFEDEPRPMPYTYPPDMGADEVDETNEISKVKIPNSKFQLTNYPNPFHSKTTIKLTLPESDLLSFLFMI